MKRKTIMIEKLALMLEAELGAGTVAVHEYETYKPAMFWTPMEKFLHLLVGYCPTEKWWQFDWELPGGFHYKTSMLDREINPDYVYDLWVEILQPTAAELWKKVREHQEEANADAGD